jgi:hypothetical protein
MPNLTVVSSTDENPTNYNVSIREPLKGVDQPYEGIMVLTYDLSPSNTYTRNTPSADSIRSNSSLDYGSWKVLAEFDETKGYQAYDLHAYVFDEVDGYVETLQPEDAYAETGPYWDILQHVDDSYIPINSIQENRYLIGSEGPGGGYIAFDKGTRDTRDWELSGDDGRFIAGEEQPSVEPWRYLEVAHETWNQESGDPLLEYSDSDSDSGAESSCESYSAGEAENPIDDWYLPSFTELVMGLDNLYLHDAGGFTSGNRYWFSGMNDNGQHQTIDLSNYKIFTIDTALYKSNYTRPVRRF